MSTNKHLPLHEPISTGFILDTVFIHNYAMSSLILVLSLTGFKPGTSLHDDMRRGEQHCHRRDDCK